LYGNGIIPADRRRGRHNRTIHFMPGPFMRMHANVLTLRAVPKRINSSPHPWFEPTMGVRKSQLVDKKKVANQQRFMACIYLSPQGAVDKPFKFALNGC
jgi:hypothetical protein